MAAGAGEKAVEALARVALARVPVEGVEGTETPKWDTMGMLVAQMGWRWHCRDRLARQPAAAR